ncbi:hypothetical protein NQ176_g9861 [Zarea fungicola]|uniref:Uncharacterized protein n=1 Tax=Zarea fungicola TaxID=93591 RepID=A0ACC1MK80_9HYPO|nr:hypothetical protein NQ176_g9861 [Lecanicillium fungicola]
MSLQTPASAFNPDVLGGPGATPLMAGTPGLPPGSQVDFTRLWSDEMMYHMTGAGVVEPDMPQPRSWEDASAYLPFNESSARNIF